MTNRLLRSYPAIHQALPCLLCALSLLASQPILRAQGEIGGVRVLRPEVGAGLVTEAVEFSFGAAVVDPGLRLRFGFGTDEGLGPGGFGDSFTLTLQDDGGTLTLVLVTMDAGGPVWAPPTPGTTPVAPESLAWSAIAYPSLTPVLAHRWAYELAVALPQSAVGRPLTLYFDLFNNQDGLASQGWFGEVVLVPEPGVWALALLGALMLWWRRRRSPWLPAPVPVPNLDLNLNLTPALNPVSELASEIKIKSRIKIRNELKNLVCALWLLLCLPGLGQLRVQAQTEAEFTLNNVTVTLAEVTPEADVYFRSLRLNRALNVWNVEVSVSNKVDRVLAGPVVVLIDGFSGTPGVQLLDGTTTEGKGFLDLSAEAGDGALSPGEVSAPRTLTLGRSGTGSPTLTTKVFAARP
ncbi:MAG TPA: PEP-CTERM sorting domain-containing protein, partial [Verrucomicrobiae bacterium]|nr:PEP-CTERM sorting domain-containing protein [Verrucomicrobiae bacterium]